MLDNFKYKIFENRIPEYICIKPKISVLCKYRKASFLFCMADILSIKNK